jgi:putative thioredoxin
MSSAETPGIVNVSESDFEREVISASHDHAVVVDFWAPWCGPCRALAPILEKVIAEQQGQVVLAKVNTDESHNLALQFQIQGIPLVIAFRNGKPVAEFEGVRPEAFVRQFVQQLLPSEVDKLLAEAKSLEVVDPIRAEPIYRQALERDSRNEPAAIGLARLLVERGQESEALALLGNVATTDETQRLEAVATLRQLASPFTDLAALRQRVQEEPKNAVARYELGCAQAAKAQYAEALEMLLSAAELDPKLASSKVREAMVKVFQIVGLHSELTNDYRNKLSTLLY